MHPVRISDAEDLAGIRVDSLDRVPARGCVELS
jgi:hypothetical protein